MAYLRLSIPRGASARAAVVGSGRRLQRLPAYYRSAWFRDKDLAAVFKLPWSSFCVRPAYVILEMLGIRSDVKLDMKKKIY
jgi:hypothetical protein